MTYFDQASDMMANEGTETDHYTAPACCEWCGEEGALNYTSDGGPVAHPDCLADIEDARARVQALVNQNRARGIHCPRHGEWCHQGEHCPAL